MRRTLAAAALVAAAGAVSVAATTVAGSGAQPGPTVGDPLAGITVAAESSGAGYSRALFPHWVESGTCDSRDRALTRAMTGVVYRPGTCKPTAGALTDPYTGSPVPFHEVDVDHLVPLKEAYQSGAAAWPTARREQFANDPINLIATAAHENRSKGDGDVAEWLPPRDPCGYVTRFVGVKRAYGLSMDPAEAAAARRALTHC